MSAASRQGALPSLRVVHVITSMPNGGAERQLELLLDRSAHATTVVCLYDAGPVADDVRAKGHEVLVLGMAGWRKAAAIPRLAAVLRRLRPDVVHVHLLAAQLWGIPAARLARVPVVVSTEHSLMADTIEGRPHSWWLRRLYRALETMTTHTVAVSATTADRLVAWGVRRERITVVDNGIDLDALAPGALDRSARAATRTGWGASEETTVLLALGRLDRVKRMDEVITAAAPRLRAGGHLLVVVGDGSLLPSLRELAGSLDVTDEVLFTGPRSDVPALLAGADVMLSASRDETFGLAVLEAVAAGLPVVYAAAPALEELDEDIPTAVHVGPGPTALAGGLARLLPAGRGAPRLRGVVPDQVRRRYGADATAAALDALHVDLCVGLVPAAPPPEPAADHGSARRRVVLASRGDALTRYLAAALERRYEVSARIDPELAQWQRLLVAATTFRPRRNAWMERFYKSSLAYRLRSAHGDRAVRALRASGAMAADDPVLQVHALFELEGVRDLQYVDCTHRQSAEHWPAWNPLRGQDLEQWYAREGRAYRRAHHLFAFSLATRDSLVDHYGVDPERVSVVGAGVNLDAFPPVRAEPPTRPPVVLMVGNDFERKGGPALLTAFAAVRAAHPGARLVLIGTDPQIGTPPPGVEVLGRVHDRQVVMDAYAAADVFALPSIFDPLPLVLLEAMAYGVPVVTSRSCGIPDVVTDGVDGLMVDPSSVDGLAAALLAVIDDPALAARLGAAGRARVETAFTWDHVVARMAPVIDDRAPRSDRAPR